MPPKLSTTRSVHCNEKDVTFVAHSPKLSLFVASDGDHVVRWWDYDTCVAEGHVILDDEVTCLALGQTVPLLVTAESSGRLGFYSVRPAIVKNQLLRTLYPDT